eukprot:68544_1
MQYHALTPLYADLKEELTENSVQNISLEQFESELASATLYMKSEKFKKNDWRACKTDEKYGIKVDEQMHIEHVVSIMLYCNHSKLCQKFRESYRKVTDETTDEVVKLHSSNFYWMVRYLHSAIEFYGETPTKRQKYFHGLSEMFIFDQLSAVYEIPTSTTWDFNIATEFSGVGGVVLKLSPKYKNEMDYSKCLNVSKISDFESEKEKLFAGMTVMAIINIYDPLYNNWDGYYDYIQSMLYFERITEQTVHQKEYYNHGMITQETKETWL